MKRNIKLTKKVDVPLSIAYQVIAEAEHYPEFIPGVEEIKTISLNDNGITAEMTFKHNFLVVRLQSLAILNKNQSILIKQLKGPFKKFQQNWYFEQVEGGTLITVTNELEFNTYLFGMLALKVLKKVMPEVLNAFIKRAEQKLEQAGI